MSMSESDRKEGPYGRMGPSTVKCPFCGAWCDCEAVDIGVGFEQCSPYGCEECGASQIGPYETLHRELDAVEAKCRWYRGDK